MEVITNSILHTCQCYPKLLGALVASYPFDNTPNSIFSSVLSTPSLTPDDDVFKHLAGAYSFNHGRMFTGEPCKVGAPQFENGTTNGAAWYPLTGGMQDYNYIWHGCMEVTLELSCCKFPPSDELQVTAINNFYPEFNSLLIIAGILGRQ